MKRALSTFGNPFGLALYDKEQQNVRGRRAEISRNQHQTAKTDAITWLVLSSEGEYLSAHEDPTDYCKAMRQLLEAISTRERLRAFWQRNLVTIAMLRRNLPDLKSEKGEHYSDILTNLYKQQMRLIWEEAKAYERRAAELEAQRSKAGKEGQPGPMAGDSQVEIQGPNGSERTSQGTAGSANVGNGHVDKTHLPISKPRRIRNKGTPSLCRLTALHHLRPHVWPGPSSAFCSTESIGEESERRMDCSPLLHPSQGAA